MADSIDYAVSRGVWLKIKEEYDRGYTYKIITPTAWTGDIIAETRDRLTNRKAFKSAVNSYTHSKGMPRVHGCGSSLEPVSTYFCAEPLWKLSDLYIEVNIVEQIKRLKNLKELIASSPDAIVPDVCPEYACTYYGTYMRKVINYDYSAIDEICDNVGAQETLEECKDGSAKRWKTCVPPGYWVEDEKTCEVMGCPDYNVKHGETFCKDFDLYRCEDGSHILVEANSKDCGYVSECTEGATRNEIYCPDGVTKKSWEECVSGEWKAKTQTCPVTCTEGEKRNVVLCPDGECMRSWEECVDGKWVAKTGVCGCSAGTTSCQGYDLYICVDGEWVQKERNSVECGYAENGKISILDPIISWIETSFDVDRKTAEMYAYLGIAGIGAVVILGVMSK